MAEDIKNEDQENCSGSCSSCGSDCPSRQAAQSLKEPSNQFSRVQKVIGVISGKGGVGKSLVTSYLSVLMRRKGYDTAVLDADITGPSIPKAFGIHDRAAAAEIGLLPAVSAGGTEVMSVNLLLDDEEMPVIWRGPVIAGTVKQFWTEVVWGDVDYMFVDMPPGTGDVPLTVFQSLPVDGIIIVTSPQELVSMIVAKAVNMAKAMNVPILGLVENYSYVKCPDCDKKIEVFGKSHIDEIAAKYQLKVLAKLPLDAAIAEKVDAGKIEEAEIPELNAAADFIEKLYPVEKDVAKALIIAVATDEHNNVNPHFGHTTEFSVYRISGGEAEKRVYDFNGSGHDDAVNFVANAGAQVLICGGLGSAAMTALMQAGILVIPGASGDADSAVQAYLDGALFAGMQPTCGCDGNDDSDCNCDPTGGCGGCCGH